MSEQAKCVLQYDVLCNPAAAKAWVFSTYLRGFLAASRVAALISPKRYYHHYHAKLEEALSRRDLSLNVAALTGSDDDFFGWALGRPGLLWYAHTKPLYRRQGVAKALVLQTVGTASHAEVKHMTPAGSSLLCAIPSKVWHFTE